MEPDAEQQSGAPARRTRYRVTVAAPKEAAQPAPEAGAVTVEGGSPQRPLTEPQPGAKPASGRVFTVYGGSAEEAERKVRAEVGLSPEHAVLVEEAGFAEGGRLVLPPDEEAAIAASLQDGRKAPNK